LGARFVTAEQLRQGIAEPGYVDPKLAKRSADRV
jgi:hypothetical protein